MAGHLEMGTKFFMDFTIEAVAAAAAAAAAVPNGVLIPRAAKKARTA
jgi:hypothetical protein